MNDDFELSPELLEAIAPEVDPRNAQVKFDAAGTLHVLERGSDGSLKNDYAVKHIEEQIRYNYKETRNEQLKEKKADNKDSRIYYIVLFVSTVIMLSAITYLAYSKLQISYNAIVTTAITITCSFVCICYSLVHLIKKYFVR